MNLKPMDENTLKFLKALVISYSVRRSVGLEKALILANIHFSNPDEKKMTFSEFMEAIKNADTDQ